MWKKVAVTVAVARSQVVSGHRGAHGTMAVSLVLTILASLAHLLLFASLAACQWHRIANVDHSPFRLITFLNLPGPPRIGFAGSELPSLMKTKDGGGSWSLPHFSDLAGRVVDISFKDSLTGWLGCDEGWFRTTDGGDNWASMNTPPVRGGPIYYDSTSHGLFAATHDQGFQIVSWDEGLTWLAVREDDHTGYAFADGNLGILASEYDWPTITFPWLRTSDGGHSWSELSMDSECYQPLAIQGTKTFFAITCVSATVLRTDDAWDTWHILYTFPEADDWTGSRSSGWVGGDISHLFVTLKSGCYMSSDQGLSWKYLCSPRSTEVWRQRSFIKYPYAYIITEDSLFGHALWMTNLDSMQYFATGISFPDSTKQTSIKAGNTVSVNLTADQSQLGIDSGHIVIRFDPALGFRSVKLPPSWVITDSSTRGGVLDLTIKGDSNAELPNPILQLTFNTYLASPSAKIYLDYAHLFGKRLNCDCQALSADGADSVEIDFDGCGDSTLLRYMSTGSPFQIESVEPNPAGSEVRVHFASAPSVPVEVGVLDVLGKLRLSREVSGQRAALEVSSLPDGVYYLRVSSGGFVETRRVVVGR